MSTSTLTDLYRLQELLERKHTRQIELLPHQQPPEGDWYGWLIQGGRGSGKTAGIAQYVTDHVNGPACLPGDMPHKMALVAPKLADAVESAIRHPTCLKSLTPAGLLQTKPGGTIFTWPNGSEMKLFGMWNRRDPDALRAGGNNCLAWLEELAAWPELEEGYRQLQLGLRVGHPHWVGSSTPRRRKPYRDIVDGERIVVTRAHMRENPYNPAEFVELMVGAYGDTAMGRQEIAGELLDDVEGALWIHEQIDKSRWGWGAPNLARAVVAIDPPGGATEAGIVTAGIVSGKCPCGVTKNLPHAVVIHDDSLMPSGPNHWATKGINRYHDSKLDKLVGEVNYGGDMVLNTVANLDTSVNTGKVTATRGKIVRAEPVAGLYGDPARPETWEQSRIHHVGVFPELENEMTSFTQEEAGQWSPNRLDALVWAITELGLSEWREARVGARAAELRI